MPPGAAPEETTNQSYLRRINLRIRTLSAQSPGSPELARMQAARADIVSRISAQELAGYEKSVNVTKTREQIAADAEAERVAMEANRDKPAI